MQVENATSKERTSENARREIIYPLPREVHRIKNPVVIRPSWVGFRPTYMLNAFLSYPIERCQEQSKTLIGVNDYLKMNLAVSGYPTGMGLRAFCPTFARF